MRKIFTYSGLLLFCLSLFSFTPLHKEDPPAGKKVKWYTWEEAMEANETNEKKIFVDLYTDWCGWCKKMDKNTFEDPEVSKYLNEHFYPVKLNAEQKEDIVWNGHTFKFVKGGRNGVHTLAYSLADGKLSYPTVIFLNEKVERIAVSPGYKEADAFMMQLKYMVEEHYKTTKWQDYLRSAGK